MWVITILSFLVTALCLVLLFFAARMLAKRIHAASKEHGLAFFRDRDARRISQLLIIVIFIMGLGLEGMGVPLGSVAGSFSWWKYLLFIGLTTTLIPELGTDVKTIMQEIRTCAKDIFKAVRPAEKPAREPAINPQFNSHRSPVNEMNTTNQQQPWTPEEVVDLGEFVEEAGEAVAVEEAGEAVVVEEAGEAVAVEEAGEAVVVEEAGEADETAPLVDEEEAEKVEVLAVGSEEGDDEGLVNLSNFAEMADTADLDFDEGIEDALDLNSSAEMADDVSAEDGENPDLEEGTGDAVDLSDFAEMADTAEDGEDPVTEETTENEHEGEDDMREFLKDFS
jgi:hypothetical protein